MPETWRLPDFADTLASWLRALDVEKPHVLGHSWGSSVALEFYRRHPAAPASLILASAYAGWSGSLSPDEGAMAHSMAEADLRDILPGIRVPTLLLYGERVERSPLPIAEKLRSQIPTAQLVVIPEAGHLANVEAPDTFNAQVRRFIRSVPPA